MKTKNCIDCQKEKRLNEYYSYTRGNNGRTYYIGRCKDCHRAYSRINTTKYRKNNPEKYRASFKKYYEKNREKEIKRTARAWREKYKDDPLFRLSHKIRSRTKRVLEEKKIFPTRTAGKMLGCDYKTLKKHLENQFEPGMTWENNTTDGWHIDHIIPLASAKTEKELIKLFHYTNLQPLWAKDNLSKGKKLLKKF